MVAAAVEARVRLDALPELADTPVAQLPSLYAPTASVSPASATDEPNSSPAPALGALTYAA